MDSTFDDISKILASYVPKLLGAAANLGLEWELRSASADFGARACNILVCLLIPAGRDLRKQ